MDSTSSTEQEFIAKFDVNNKPLYVKLLWKNHDEDLFHLKVFYEDGTWTGTYSKELAAKRIMKLDETEEEYYRNVKKCLGGYSEDYIFDFNKGPTDLTSASFTWKKRYQGAVKVHGVVPLQQDNVPTSKNILIDSLLEKNKNLLSEVENAKETNNNLKLDLEQYIQRLKELTENKILLESTLYGRFVQVLNEKKKRIQLLEDNLKKFKSIE